MVMIPAALLAGIITALTACSNYPVLTAIAAYKASSDQKSLRVNLSISTGYLIATASCLALIATVAVSAQAFTQYGKLIIGFIVIFFGINMLGFVPFKLPKLNLLKTAGPEHSGGAVIFGLVMGTASSATSFSCCAPLLWVVLGAVTLKGSIIFSTVSMAAFAIGFCVPAIAVLLGVSTTGLSKAMNKHMDKVKIAAGIILIAMGFWFLAGF
jgi:cytochrome c biogenesis protein CcdA